MDEIATITMSAIKVYAYAIELVFGLAVFGGCASTKVNEQTSMSAAEGLARPNQIWVSDFRNRSFRYAGQFVVGRGGGHAKYAA